MTPKEKAEELVDKYYNILPFDKYVITKDEDLSWEYNDWEEAKKCALIAVDEIIFVVSKYNDTQAEVSYWQQVKQEIEKL
jgi:hypothetical protein